MRTFSPSPSSASSHLSLLLPILPIFPLTNPHKKPRRHSASHWFRVVRTRRRPVLLGLGLHSHEAAAAPHRRACTYRQGGCVMLGKWHIRVMLDQCFFFLGGGLMWRSKGATVTGPDLCIVRNGPDHSAFRNTTKFCVSHNTTKLGQFLCVILGSRRVLHPAWKGAGMQKTSQPTIFGAILKKRSVLVTLSKQTMVAHAPRYKGVYRTRRVQPCTRGTTVPGACSHVQGSLPYPSRAAMWRGAAPVALICDTSACAAMSCKDGQVTCQHQ